MKSASMFVRALLLVVATGSPAVAAVYDDDWVEVRSPNFVAFSAIRESRARNLVQELEDFRRLVTLFTNAKVMDARVPTVIFIFPGSFPDAGLVRPAAGYFSQRMRGNYAVVNAGAGMPLNVLMQHEYTHFVMRNQGRLDYPRWYEEGFAELLSTVSLSDGKFDLGNAYAGRQMDLMLGQWMPFDWLLDDEQTMTMNRHDGAAYYAQSWALVHYLTFGRPGRNMSTDMGKYLAARERGVAPLPAFEESFGAKVSDLSSILKAYLKTAKYSKGALTEPFAADQVTARKMSIDEVAAALGNLCLVTGHAKAALPYVEVALKANPRNATALVNRADLYKFAGEFAAAEPLYQQAIDLEPDSDLHHLDFAEYWLDRARLVEGDSGRKEFLRKARQEFVQANKLNDRNPETLATYGVTFAQPGQDPAKGLDTLELAHSLLPSSTDIKLMLATLYVANGRPADARPLLVAIRTWSEGVASAAADNLLQLIDRKAEGGAGGGSEAGADYESESAPHPQPAAGH